MAEKKEEVQISEDGEVDGKGFQLKQKGQERKVRSDNDEREEIR